MMNAMAVSVMARGKGSRRRSGAQQPMGPPPWMITGHGFDPSAKPPGCSYVILLFAFTTGTTLLVVARF